MKKSVALLWLVLAATGLWAGGSSEAAASSTRGVYLASRGTIIPPAEVMVESYIASIDYSYPNPEGALGVTFASGNRQLSTSGQEEVFHIGIQARRSPFSELPPLNLAFVIDHSGSMGAEEKLEWVKQAFDIFIGSVRDTDFVSLVVFDDKAQVVFPSTKMNSAERRRAFRSAVASVMPEGGTNLRAGLELGYQQVLANFRKEYTNRVLFLTDGMGQIAGLLEMADQFRAMGINVSTIGVGKGFDQQLMVDLAERGGGSSRFISDREEMEETFGSELDRMVVPAGRNLRIDLSLASGVTLLGTWGYSHSVEGSTIHYVLNTLHHGDYETILAQVRLPAGLPAGRRELARLEVTYDDLGGTRKSAGPYALEAELVDREYPVAGFSNGLVLRSGTMLRFAQSLVRIGELYYGTGAPGAGATPGTDGLTQAREAAAASRRELANVKLRLDNVGFDDEIVILDAYLATLGKELESRGGTPAATSDEIPPPVRSRPLAEHVQGLFREMILSIPSGDAGVIAVSGFAMKDGKETGLTAYLNEMAVIEMSRLPGLRLVERSKLDQVISEQALSLSDLMDTTTAVKVGQLLAADRIITGTVVEMGESVVVFGRIIDLESGEVVSAAQVIMPKDSELRSLLR